MPGQEQYETLRQTHPRFVYESYQYDVQPDGLHIVFTFRIGSEITFSPTAFIPTRPFLKMDQDTSLMDKLVFNIGMIELISYWKCACPPVVEVRCGELSESQIAFWKKIYYNGLGEFFYLNGIDAKPDGFLNFEVTTPCHDIERDTKTALTYALPHTTSYLVPIGGGKDSVVTLELLNKASDARPIPLIMNPRGATENCVMAAGYGIDQTLVIHRTIAPRLLELNAQGYLNGHTPFSAMLAFYTLLAAHLSGISNIALSNESSANESTVAGTGINHQYSKSLDFENDFRRYVSDNLSPEFNYFSFLRPLSELQIAMLFSSYEKYHDVFRSCNAGSKTDTWCGKCAKCLFAYIILSPFIPPTRLNSIFGKDMFGDTTLKPLLDQLTGNAPTKPFECVGTIGEVHSALSMAMNRWYGNNRPALLAEYQATAPTTPLDTLQSHHNLKPELLALLQEHVQRARNSQ